MIFKATEGAADEVATHLQTLHEWTVPSLMSPFSKNSQTSAAVLAAPAVRRPEGSDGAIVGGMDGLTDGDGSIEEPMENPPIDGAIMGAVDGTGGGAMGPGLLVVLRLCFRDPEGWGWGSEDSDVFAFTGRAVPLVVLRLCLRGRVGSGSGDEDSDSPLRALPLPL